MDLFVIKSPSKFQYLSDTENLDHLKSDVSGDSNESSS